MRRTVLTTIVLIVALVFSGAIPALADEGAQPVIVLPEIRYDFGKLFEQDSYEHDFVVKNRGGADLRISKVKPG